MNDGLRAEIEALTEGAGFVDLSGRCVVQLTGDDRQAFLHNFCTNEIKQLVPNHLVKRLY